MNCVGTHIGPIFRLDIGKVGEEEYRGGRGQEVGDRESRE
jgi:hypothetical protein